MNCWDTALDFLLTLQTFCSAIYFLPCPLLRLPDHYEIFIRYTVEGTFIQWLLRVFCFLITFFSNPTYALNSISPQSTKWIWFSLEPNSKQPGLWGNCDQRHVRLCPSFTWKVSPVLFPALFLFCFF